MNANELRIGNYVHESISNLDGKVCIDILRILDKKPSDAYLSIPLTEDWLVKFGFELLCEKSDGFKQTVYSMQKPSWTLAKLEKGWGVGFWQGGQDLIYVHQLQNLYFALTNKELKCLQP